MLKGKKPKKSLERFFWVSLLSETAEAFWPLGVSFEGVEDGEEVEAPFLTNFRFHLWEYLGCRLGFSHGSVVKGSTCQCRRCGFISWLEKIPWRRKWQPTPVFLPGKSCGPRNQRVRYNLVAKITTECSYTRVLKNPHVSEGFKTIIYFPLESNVIIVICSWLMLRAKLRGGPHLEIFWVVLPEET